MTRMSNMGPERLWGLFCSLSRCPPCTCATRERETELDPHLGPSLGPTLLQTRGCMVHPRVEKEEAQRPGRGQQACSQVLLPSSPAVRGCLGLHAPSCSYWAYMGRCYCVTGVKGSGELLCGVSGRDGPVTKVCLTPGDEVA